MVDHTNITILSLIDPNIYIEVKENSEQNQGSMFLNKNIHNTTVNKNIYKLLFLTQ